MKIQVYKADIRGHDMRVLYVGFKGKGNSSNKLVSSLVGDKLFLTNSYTGLKKDIDRIEDTYDLVYMFGLDKSLKGNIRIDTSAEKDGVRLYSDIDTNAVISEFHKKGIQAETGYTPTRYLCNEAYWYMLKKYDSRVLFFHVPSIKYITKEFIEKIKSALSIIVCL